MILKSGNPSVKFQQPVSRSPGSTLAYWLGASSIGSISHFY